MTTDRRRLLPSVTDVLDVEAVRAHVTRVGRETIVAVVREVIDELRASPDPLSVEAALRDRVVAEVVDRLERREGRASKKVVNATGVVLHTNLGRAPLGSAAVAAMVEAAGATNVEYDLQSGRRASRGEYAAGLARDLTGAEDGLVVNNGAAALVLSLAALAGGRRVAVSRGELVEIGGSFRLPEIIEAAGVKLVEVGTTNRTRAADYQRAITADPSVTAILRVHPSNYRVEGFTERPGAHELAEIARAEGIAFIHDVGSGLLHDDLPLPAGPGEEPSLRTALADGADIAIASGDKLLGGPQAGLLVGRGDAVQRCRAHPLARALRVDKLRLAALEATLRAYRRDDLDGIPSWFLLGQSPSDLRDRAERLLGVARSVGLDADVVELEGVVGAGSAPGRSHRSVGLAIGHRPNRTAGLLATATPPVVGRVWQGRLALDLSSVQPEDDEHLRKAIEHVART